MAYGTTACGASKEPDAAPETWGGHLPDAPVLLQGDGEDKAVA